MGYETLTILVFVGLGLNVMNLWELAKLSARVGDLPKKRISDEDITDLLNNGKDAKFWKDTRAACSIGDRIDWLEQRMDEVFRQIRVTQ